MYCHVFLKKCLNYSESFKDGYIYIHGVELLLEDNHSIQNQLQSVPSKSDRKHTADISISYRNTG